MREGRWKGRDRVVEAIDAKMIKKLERVFEEEVQQMTQPRRKKPPRNNLTMRGRKN